MMMESNGACHGSSSDDAWIHPYNSSASGPLFRSDVSSSRGYVRNGSFPNESFITISDLSLRTQPSQLPPPSRPPPPPLDVKMRDSGRFTPNCNGVSSEGKSGESSKEACVWEENNGRSEVAEVAHRQKIVEKVQLAQEVCGRDESDKKVRINNHAVEYGKRQTRENEQEAAFESAIVQIFGKTGESTTLAAGERGKVIMRSQVAFDQESDMVNVMSNRIVRESIDSATKVDAAHLAVLQVKGSNQRTTQQVHESQSIERKMKTLNDNHSLEEKEAEKVKKEKLLEMERLRKMEEQREREREREKDRMVVDRAALEACERAYRDKPSMGARRRAECAAVERAFAETCAFEKAMVTKCFNSGMRPSASSPQLQASASFTGSRYPYPAVNGSYHEERSEGVEGESAQRCKARLERHRRTSERVAKALAEKSMRDLLAQREQAERNRLAETLDADVKRWSSGKEGNLRALLSTLQYILGPDSGWHPVLLKEVIESAATKRAYRKATLCVHPDKLQQRGATIKQKYVYEKVFDLLKDAWNKFKSEER